MADGLEDGLFKPGADGEVLMSHTGSIVTHTMSNTSGMYAGRAVSMRSQFGNPSTLYDATPTPHDIGTSSFYISQDCKSYNSYSATSSTVPGKILSNASTQPNGDASTRDLIRRVCAPYFEEMIIAVENALREREE